MGKYADNFKRTRDLAATALLFAVAIVLSIVESMLPVSVPVSGVKLGLSNIPVMYVLFLVSKGQAILIAVLKAVFVFATRGVIAGTLSFCGGILSILVMSLLIFIFKDRISYMVLSIFGSVSHNMGQLIAVTLFYPNMYLWTYIPVLIIAGVIAGMLTSTLLKLVMPAFKRLHTYKSDNKEELV